jgi:hypothetical protein
VDVADREDAGPARLETEGTLVPIRDKLLVLQVAASNSVSPRGTSISLYVSSSTCSRRSISSTRYRDIEFPEERVCAMNRDYAVLGAVSLDARDGARHDHEEVMAGVPLVEQHVSGPDLMDAADRPEPCQLLFANPREGPYRSGVSPMPMPSGSLMSSRRQNSSNRIRCQHLCRSTRVHDD